MILGVDQKGGIGIILDIKIIVQIVVQDIFDHPPQKSDIRSGTKPDINIGLGRSAGEAGIDMDKDGPLILGGLDPFKGNRMVFGHIAAHVQDDIGIAEIDKMIGHGTASERLSQSRYRGAVSDTGLVLDVHEAQDF